MLYHNRFRCCPECLADSAHHRRVWDHKQLGICPIHRVSLIDRCRVCEDQGLPASLTWRRHYLLYCTGGHDLREARQELLPGVQGTAAVYRFLGYPGDGPDLPADFRDLPFQPLLDVLFFLGRMEIVVASGKLRDFCGHEMRTDPAILDAGVRVALGWPDSFEALACSIRSRVPDHRGVGIQYDSLHRFAAASAGKPYAGLIQGAYARHLAGRPDMSTGTWPSFLPLPPEVPRVLTVKEALRLLSPDGSYYVGIKTHPLWKNLTRMPRGRVSDHYLIEAEVHALREKMRASVSPRAADDLLGLGPGRTQELCTAGLIRFTNWAGHRGRGDDRLVDRSEIQRIRDEVRRHVLEKPPGKPIPFKRLLLRAIRPQRASFADVYQAILAGQLRGYLSDAGEPLFENLGNNILDAVNRLCHKIGHEHRTANPR